jgi:nucleolar MIF4G domain-containing protein 1
VSAEARGRWWVVGSAFSTVDTGAASAPAAAADKAMDEYMALAKKHRMNTDARRSIFCLLLSSEDYLDAFQKITKLDLKGPQERDIILVLLYCCGMERTFNPYYMHLAVHFCGVSHHLRFSFQTAFWDRFKQLHSTPPREAANLATLLAHLVGTKNVPLAVLKPVEFESLSANGVLFFRIFFETLLTQFDEATIAGVFKRLAVRQDDPNLLRAKEGITLFYLQGMGSKAPDPDADEEARRRHKLLRERIRYTKRLLLDSASADIF